MTARLAAGLAGVLGAAIVVLAAPSLPTSPAAPAAAGEARVVLDVASTFSGDMPLIGEGARRLAEKVERATGGTLVLRLHEPGALVPAAETVRAVADGRIDAAWAGAGWFAGENSAFALFSSIPFGPGIGEYLAWMHHGGGLEAARALFHAHAIHNLPCALIPPEASGWFPAEMRSVADLAGLRMRIFGLGARVMEKFGVRTVQIAPGDILTALRDGTLDAAEFSLPAVDAPLGFDQAVSHYYFPGWHQPTTFFDLYIRKERWDALADHHKAVIELACGDTIRDTIAASEAAQGRALRELQDRGVRLRRWPAEMLVAFEAAWREVVAEESARNPTFAAIHGSLTAFRERYAVWHRLGYLE